MGRLAGIARRHFALGPMEVLEQVEISVDGGLAGDFRSGVKPGRDKRRQVSLIETGDWAAAMAEVGHSIPWQERRANLLVEGLDLPQVEGARLRIGADVVLEVTCECDPCHRMETIAEGLKAALTPDWRGGALARVVAGGHVRVGDEIRIEPVTVRPE